MNPYIVALTYAVVGTVVVAVVLWMVWFDHLRFASARLRTAQLIVRAQ